MNTEELNEILDALESYHGYMEPLTTVVGGPRVPAEQSTTGKVEKAITLLRKAIQEDALREVQRLGQEIEQEPVAWMQEGQPELYVEEQKDEKRGYVIPLYTHPQPKQDLGIRGSLAHDAQLKEKNT